MVRPVGRCCDCDEPVADGYRIDPETGLACDKLRCRRCYELMASRSLRDAWTPIDLKRFPWDGDDYEPDEPLAGF